MCFFVDRAISSRPKKAKTDLEAYKHLKVKFYKGKYRLEGPFYSSFLGWETGRLVRAKNYYGSRVLKRLTIKSGKVEGGLHFRQGNSSPAPFKVIIPKGTYYMDNRNEYVALRAKLVKPISQRSLRLLANDSQKCLEKEWKREQRRKLKEKGSKRKPKKRSSKG